MSCVRLSEPCVPDPPDCLSVAHPGSVVGTMSLLEFLEEPPVLRPVYGDTVTWLGPASRRGTLSLVRQSSSDSWYSCCYPCITNRKTEVQREKKLAQISTPRQNQERNPGPLPPLDFFLLYSLWSLGEGATKRVSSASGPGQDWRRAELRLER